MVALTRVHLRNIHVHALTETECVEHIFVCLDRGCGGWVATPNLDILRRTERDPAFCRLICSADLLLADGMPLVWASRLQHTPLPERVSGSTLVATLCAHASQRGRSVFLLGGTPGTAEGAAAALRRQHPALAVAGTLCPPLGFEHRQECIESILQVLSHSRPDIVFVALGSPKQDMLIHRIRHVLPHAWWLGIGVTFSFLSGELIRAPRWMQRAGLEWLHRLCQQPQLGRRYLVDGLPYAVRVLTASALAGFAMKRCASH